MISMSENCGSCHKKPHKNIRCASSDEEIDVLSGANYSKCVTQQNAGLQTNQCTLGGSANECAGDLHNGLSKRKLVILGWGMCPKYIMVPYTSAPMVVEW